MQQRDSEQTGAEHRFFLILWSAMLAAVVIYFVVMRLVPPPAPRDSPALVNILIVMAVVLVAASFMLKSTMLGRARQAGRPELRRAARIVALTLCDAAAILGLVAWMLTGAAQSYYALLIGFVGVLLHFPAREI